MTANCRIVVNFLATYGRSVFALVCGLFSSRWILAALGQVDYGLWGLVGGLITFVVFINEMLAGVISRYYAVSVGLKARDPVGGIEECRKWFNTAFIIHTALSVVLTAIGYPAGVWAVRHFLTIPIDRIDACVWVWRATCVSCFFGMLTVPYRAMYTARQEIAELTLYSFAQTLINIITAYLMVTYERDWLVTYAWVTSLAATIPSVVIMGRALMVFPECSFVRSYMFIPANFKELWRFVIYRFWGVFASLLQNQGVTIIVNKVMGPAGNATMALGRVVASHTVTLSNSMSTAIGPAIYNAYGVGDMDHVKRLAFQASKLGAALYLFVVLPAALEVHYLMKLWLGSPPPLAAEICLLTMAAYMTERISDGQVTVIYATGKIERFQIVLCLSCLLGLFLAGLFAWFGWGIVGIGTSIVLFKSVIMVARGYYARRLIGLSVVQWLKEIIIPTVFVIGICYGVSFGLKHCIEEGFIRLCVSTVLVEVVYSILCWTFMLSMDERKYIQEKIVSRIVEKMRLKRHLK